MPVIKVLSTNWSDSGNSLERGDCIGSKYRVPILDAVVPTNQNIITYDSNESADQADGANDSYEHMNLLMFLICVDWILTLDSTTIDIWMPAFGICGCNQRYFTVCSFVEMCSHYVILSNLDIDEQLEMPLGVCTQECPSP